jgi:hypothetical protein
MPLPLLPLRRTATAVAVMLASMFVLWWGLWLIGAAQWRDFIEDWITARRTLGYNVTYDARETEGFPRRISLHFTNFVLKNPDGVTIHANDVSLSTLPWQWQRFDGKLKHGFELTIPFSGDKTLLITTVETVRNHTELEDNGDWKYVSLKLTDAKALWGAAPFFGASAFEIALERPDMPPKNNKDAGLTFEGSAEDITLPPGLDAPFGANVTKLETNFRVMGTVPDPRKKDSVNAWNGENGVVEFDKFFLQWGPLVLATRGTLGLDDDLQPEGAFSGQIGNHEQVLKTLIAHDYIPKHEAGMLDSALNLFSKKSTVAGTPGIEVPITVQLGGLFLGPVRMFEFPEIMWEEPPPESATPAAATPPPSSPAQ